MHIHCALHFFTDTEPCKWSCIPYNLKYGMVPHKKAERPSGKTLRIETWDNHSDTHIHIHTHAHTHTSTHTHTCMHSLSHQHSHSSTHSHIHIYNLMPAPTKALNTRLIQYLYMSLAGWQAHQYLYMTSAWWYTPPAWWLACFHAVRHPNIRTS